MKILLSFLVFFFSLSYSQIVLEDNVDVKITVKTSFHKEEGKISFTFQPKNGIHINTEPVPEINFDSSTTIIENGKFLPLSKTKKEYLETTKPVVYQFTIPKNTSAGKYIIKGELTYFYCSDKEGWCNRFIQSFELPIEIGKKKRQ